MAGKKEDIKNEMEEAFSETTSICEACGGPLKPERSNLEEFEGGKLYLMENVPAYICQICGEMWVPEPILKEFEKMMDTAKHHHEPAKEAKQEKKKRTKKQKK